MEKRVNVTFLVKLQKSPSETLEMLKQLMLNLLRARVTIFGGINVFREDVNDEKGKVLP
jgi:hypothetical protein